jgi:uncharacterized membrane protein
MSQRAYLRNATLLAAAGVAFSGYLSLTRLTRGICAFEEPCPFFLGHPACYTGFALFAGAFAISLLAWIRKTEESWPMFANTLLGIAGSVFAGMMSLEEVRHPVGYKLGLPTCAYGFVFFLVLLVYSLAAWVKHHEETQHGSSHHPA